MSHVVIVGGTGYAGSHIAAEAVGRGHQVTSYSRSEPTDPIDGVDYRIGSLSDPDILSAVAHGARLGIVGGAASSLVHEGGPLLLDSPDFNEDWKPEARAGLATLEALRESRDDLRWFFVSPAALFGSYAPGETTGAYRTGGDVLVTKPDGSSEISGTDFALAFVDEIDRAAHPNQRFTVGH